MKLIVGKEDGGGDLINDNCDKYDDDNCDVCGDNTSCNVSIIDFENLMFPFSVRWRWSYNVVPCLKSCLAKSSLGLGIGLFISIGLINFYSPRRPMNVSW